MVVLGRESRFPDFSFNAPFCKSHCMWLNQKSIIHFLPEHKKMAERNYFTRVVEFYLSRIEKLLQAGKVIIYKTMEH